MTPPQVVQAEVERLEMKAALFEEEAGRTGRLEEEARAREEQLRALRDQVKIFVFSVTRICKYSSICVSNVSGGLPKIFCFCRFKSTGS